MGLLGGLVGLQHARLELPDAITRNKLFFLSCIVVEMSSLRGMFQPDHDLLKR